MMARMISYWPDGNFRTGKSHTTTESIAKFITKYTWSPCVWENPFKRNQETFKHADYLVLDFDSGEMTLEQAYNTWIDTFHIIGTTRSHTEAHHRFRVILPFEEKVNDIDVYRYQLITAMKFYPCDEQCKDGARIFYPCKEIYSINRTQGSYYESVKRPPKDFKNIRAKPTKIGISSTATFFMTNPINVGIRQQQMKFTAKDLASIGLCYETIKDIIMCSPTMKAQGKNGIPAFPVSEVESTVKAAIREVAS